MKKNFKSYIYKTVLAASVLAIGISGLTGCASNEQKDSAEAVTLTNVSYYPKGMGGAIITVRAGSKEKAFRLINNLKYASIATNIGDIRTLVIHPASTIYTHSTEQQKASAGVYDDTIRISVGIEDIDDLIGDFKQAIEKI